MRYLIVSGDDFGFSESVNRAIIQAHRDGILTSCSLMVGAPAFDHAVELARANPRLAVGVHAVLAMGRSVLPPSRIPHLVDRDSRFANEPWRAGFRYFFSPAARAELRAELLAQFERFAATGLKLSHVDGHLHMHLHPTVFPIIVGLSKRFGAPRIRIPHEEFFRHLQFNRRRPFQSALWSLVFRTLRRKARGRINGDGFLIADRVYGLLQSGAITEKYWLDLIPRLNGRINEVYCHPCIDEPNARHGESVEGGAQELAALLSSQVRRRLVEARVRPISYEEAERVGAG